MRGTGATMGRGCEGRHPYAVRLARRMAGVALLDRKHSVRQFSAVVMGPCLRRDDIEYEDRIDRAMACWVYILASGRHGTLYTGVTNDLGRRMEEHRLGRGSEFVKQHGIDRLVYVEPYDAALDAIEREKQLKRWKRDWKIALIEKDNLDWSDLSCLVVD